MPTSSDFPTFTLSSKATRRVFPPLLFPPPLSSSSASIGSSSSLGMGVEFANHAQYSSAMDEEEDKAHDASLSDFELVDSVRNALKAASSGDPDSYNQLVGVLHYKKRLAPDEVALLVTCLRALSGAVSYIDHLHHGTLLSAIFGMNMWNYGPDVMDALIELIISLAATNGKFVEACLEMLVSNFLPPGSFMDVLKLPRGATKKEQVQEKVHAALKDIAHLVPIAPARLFPVIRQRMPDFRRHEPLLVIYVENILKLEGSPLGQLVGSPMLIMLIVDRLIELDVEIGWDCILSDDSTKGIFEMELEVEDLGDPGADGYEVHKEYFLTGNVVADKLDSLMVVTFEHLKNCHDNGRLIEVFESLLQSFQITILNAYKSKFAQFVMFYACSLDPENCGVRFAHLLADVFTSSNFPLLTRMSAVAYLASYMARAKFLTTPFIISMLERLAEWCSEYCQTHDADMNPKAHRVFYAGCQAIMYILCFRMRSIVEVPRFKSQLQLVPLARILKNPLDPLKVCLPSIVDEFVRQAKAAHLLKEAGTFAFNDVLESELSKAYGGFERLDMFFPFDPCLLRRSDSYIEPTFVSWGMVRPTYNDDLEDDSDEDFPDKERDGIDAESRGADIAESLEETSTNSTIR